MRYAVGIATFIEMPPAHSERCPLDSYAMRHIQYARMTTRDEPREVARASGVATVKASFASRVRSVWSDVTSLKVARDGAQIW